MKKGNLNHLAIVMCCFLCWSAYAQLGLPQVEEVYGGRINAIDAVALTPTITRVFIATESANSIFYADVDHTTTPPTFGRFYALADADTNDGFGKDIRNLAADGASGWVFFEHHGNLYGASETPGSITPLANGVLALASHGGYLYYLKDEGGALNMYFGAIDAATGAFTPGVDSPVAVVTPFTFPPQPMSISIAVSPVNDSLYIFMAGSPPTILRSSQKYNALTTVTTFTKLDVSSLDTTDHYQAFGIGPDGRIFIGGVTGIEPNHFKRIAFTDSEGAVWDTVRVPFSGTSGPNIACAGTDTAYSVFFGSAFNDLKGEDPNFWKSIGQIGQETHPNDGPVAADPLNPDVVYMTTDQGIGASTTRGFEIFEIDEGVEAVQVNDFDMNDAKTIAWTASKSGIRRVVDYGTPSEMWTIMFPMNDGSPYYSIAMDKSDSTGNTAYAGNVRLYKTTNGGVNWDRILDVQDPGHGFSFWSYISAIAIHPHDPKVVFVGVNSPQSGVNGGIFYTGDGGATWNRLDTSPYNTEVQDFAIVFNSDSTTTIYVACEYISDGTNSSYGVKTITYDPESETITFENDMIGETGTPITNFSASDLAVTSDGDVLAAGNNGTSGEPRVYGKRADSTHWEMFTSNQLPPNGRLPALTIGEDPAGNPTPFVAVESSIYYLDGTSWKLGFAYPVGMDINVLFWDDLLVGTGTGLYGHFFDETTGIAEPGSGNGVPAGFQLLQNYPNPFNPATTIRYAVPTTSRVKLSIYNITGQQVATLVNGVHAAGSFEIRWEAENLPSGIYFYRLDAFATNGRQRHFSEVRKMILLK